MLQNETVAVTMTSLTKNLSLSKDNATCEIYTAAIVLKAKLNHYVFHHTTNISVNVIRLFALAISHLHSIATIQWQIYVREYIYIYIYVYIRMSIYYNRGYYQWKKSAKCSIEIDIWKNMM